MVVFKYKMNAFVHRNRIKLLAAALVLCCLLILNTDLSPDLYFLNASSENVSCYYEEGDELIFVSNRGFQPSEDSIYFHETSCRGGLNSRQACAVEAAARMHRHWDVHVLFLAPIRDQNSRSFQALQSYDRVSLARVNILDYAVNTPLESLVANGALNRTRWRISHTSDALRYLTMYKWGGIYLDLDTVVVKPLDSLERNWSARESDVTVAAGAMSFSRDPVGRMFADAAIRDLADNFRGDDWGHNGPGVITRVLKKKCQTSIISSMSAMTCQGFEIYGPNLFYPIRWQDAYKYLEPGEISPEPYIFHVWNHFTASKPVPTHSLYAELARQYCPRVYEAYGDSFGN